MRTRTRILFTIAGVLAVAAAWLAGQPIALALVGGVDWVQGAGWVGIAAFVALYALATWAMVPASWLQMTAGFLFGPVVGFLAAKAMSVGFGSISFWLARTALRGPLERRLRGRWLDALDQAVGEDGVGMVALLRVPPVSPYNVVNYALGLTPIRFPHYLAGTVLGGLVPLILYPLVGASVSDLAAVLSGAERGPDWVQWVGLAVTVVATIGVSARVRAVLKRQGLTSTAPAAPPSPSCPSSAPHPAQP